MCENQYGNNYILNVKDIEDKTTYYFINSRFKYYEWVTDNMYNIGYMSYVDDYNKYKIIKLLCA